MRKLLLLLCSTLPIIAFAQKANNQRKPNIIYIYADDMGIGELGCYGQQQIKTPHLDQLASEGMKFTKHYSGTAVCAPSRCMLLTGRHSGHSYIRGNYELGGFTDATEGGQMPLPEGTYTIGHMLQNAGYVTGAIGKWGLGMFDNSGNPNKQGFDYFYGYLDQKQAHNYYPTHLWENGHWDTLENEFFLVHSPLKPSDTGQAAYDHFIGKEYSMDKLLEKSVQFIKQHKDQPFFLYLPYTGPHVSLQAPKEAVAKYIGTFDEQPYRGNQGYASTLHPKSTYAAMISYFDHNVGAIMELLQQLGLDDNTVVMFSSDNGPTFHTGGINVDDFNSKLGMRGYKGQLYEGGIRAPFIVRWPGHVKAGTTSDLLSNQFDMMATFAAIAGIKAPENDGINILPTLEGKKQKEHHDFMYFEFPERGGQLAIRVGDMKGIKTGMKKNHDAPWQVYDLSKDPDEKNDIASQNPQFIKQLDDIVKREHLRAHITEWEFIDPKTGQ
ncbi:N-acetylgalactosamine-6-sulfatase [Chitinophaga caeni]|uniref:N-acetylgalactosamine-6-sulfatase n=1 Tax=Chitinophaga caeni TaxID=2029983 RepID=A0A291QVK5_9BACT|nr:arylsulfatase [Chitinophaga caeni]ATL47894.1 N-acetylgalactosamine-6-sulfatase [Chitinophaga caeni]